MEAQNPAPAPTVLVLVNVNAVFAPGPVFHTLSSPRHAGCTPPRRPVCCTPTWQRQLYLRTSWILCQPCHSVFRGLRWPLTHRVNQGSSTTSTRSPSGYRSSRTGQYRNWSTAVREENTPAPGSGYCDRARRQQCTDGPSCERASNVDVFDCACFRRKRTSTADSFARR